MVVGFVTIEEVMRGVTPLPWRAEGDELLVQSDTIVADFWASDLLTGNEANCAYAARAANAFPALVAFVERQQCDCFSHVTCRRCTVLRAALDTTKP